MEMYKVNLTKKSLTTTAQFDILLKEIRANPTLARGFAVFGGNKTTIDNEWRKLSSKLNAIGPPTRTAAKWKKVWSDMKTRAKKKIGDNLSQLNNAVDGSSVLVLTKIEEETAKIMGFCSTDPIGLSSGDSFNFKKGPNEEFPATQTNLNADSEEVRFVELSGDDSLFNINSRDEVEEFLMSDISETAEGCPPDKSTTGTRVGNKKQNRHNEYISLLREQNANQVKLTSLQEDQNETLKRNTAALEKIANTLEEILKAYKQRNV